MSGLPPAWFLPFGTEAPVRMMAALTREIRAGYLRVNTVGVLSAIVLGLITKVAASTWDFLVAMKVRRYVS